MMSKTLRFRILISKALQFDDIFITGSKVPFWQNGKIAKMALLNPCMKFKNYFSQKTSFEALWKCHLLKIFVICSRIRQIQDLGQSKYKLTLFSKRTHGISKWCFQHPQDVVYYTPRPECFRNIKFSPHPEEKDGGFLN